MKAPRFWKWSLGITLALVPILAGWSLGGSNPPADEPAGLGEAANAEGQTGVAESPGSVEAQEPAVELSDAAVKPLTSEKPVPGTIQPTGPASEVIKLANSGVEEPVLMAFVTNSTSLFDLRADEIIYLNDIGVPSAVVTAMIQRDQALKAGGIVTSQPGPAPATPAPAEPGAPNPYAPSPAAPMPPPPTAPPEYAESAPPPVAATAETSEAGFYQPLTPYGTWVDVAGYGPCWQPNVVTINPEWQPYFDGGHWVYSDCGWYWLSDYSWGWAPFHYGRWFRHNRIGWCWAPDRVWGPSWVCWRDSDNYCGWAPLPPGAWYRPGIGLTFWGRHVGVGFDFGLGINSFAFVELGHFQEHRLHHFALSRDGVATVYQNTVVEANIGGTSRRVINSGIAPDRVAAATHTTIRKVSIRETTGAAQIGGRAERIASDGKTLTISRPQLRQETGGQPTTPTRSRTDAGSLNRRIGAAASVRDAAPNQGAPAIRPTTPVAPKNERIAATGRQHPSSPAKVLESAPTASVRTSPNPKVESPRLAENSQVQKELRSPTTASRALQNPRPPGFSTTIPQARSTAQAPTVPRATDLARNERPAPMYNPAPIYNYGTRQPTAAYDNRVSPAPTVPARPEPVQRQVTPAYQPQVQSQWSAPANSRGAYAQPTEVPRYSPAPVPVQREFRTAPAAEVPRYTPSPSAQPRMAPTPSYSAPRSYSAPAYTPPQNTAPRAPVAPSPAQSQPSGNNRNANGR
jgi:hypothetical protein